MWIKFNMSRGQGSWMHVNRNFILEKSPASEKPDQKNSQYY